MSKVGIINKDGKVQVIHPAPGFTVEDVAKKANIDLKEVKEMDISKLPKDRKFRNAWESTATTVKENLAKSKEIHLERLREKRNKKLDELDKEEIKFMGQGKEVELAEVRAEKQRLRDLPDTIKLTARKVADLPAIWDDALDSHEAYEE